MFGSHDQHPAWDHAHHYLPRRLELYYEDRTGQALVPVPLAASLGDTIAQERLATDDTSSDKTQLKHLSLSTLSFEVAQGTPSFIVLVADSAFREHFLSKYSKTT